MFGYNIEVVKSYDVHRTQQYTVLVY